MNHEPLPSLLPLAPATLHILLALAGDRMHGYGIMQEVTRLSQGQYKLGPGTLYDNLQRMMKQGLVEESASRIGEDERRRCYELTARGREVLAADLARLHAVMKEARRVLRGWQPRSV
jgi:DNA-binding PadR family transcriptional regulator